MAPESPRAPPAHWRSGLPFGARRVREAGWVAWAWYEDGALVIVLRTADADLERLWEAIGPVVGVLSVLEGSDAWIRQGVGPGMRNGPRSRKLWGK